MIIKSVRACEILASSGNPTIEIEVRTDAGTVAASVPAGTSTGRYEVKPFAGSVSSSIKAFNSGLHQVLGLDVNTVEDVLSVEKKIECLIPAVGGNSVLCLSYALLRAIDSDVYKLFSCSTIPYQVCNIIGGGKHAKGTEFQEFHAIPITERYPESMAASTNVHTMVGDILASGKVGLEGAWVSKVGNEKSIEVLKRGCETVSDETGVEIDLGIDVAASSFYNGGKYVYGDKKLDGGEQVDYILELIRKFGLRYVEDPLHEDDFEGFAELQKKTKCMVVGDDLFATDTSRIRPVCTGAIVKPNQVGAIYRVIDFIKALKKYKMEAVMSHRSQETMDPMISDLAVGLGTRYIKVSVFGKERVAKMRRLGEIYKQLRL